MKRIILPLRWLLPCLLLLMGSASAAAQCFTSSPIPDGVFERMQGRSFAEGCTVKRDELRYLRVLHYDDKGKVQTGELVCNVCIAQDLLEIFEELYKAQYPIEKMRLIDEYGAKSKSSGADDDASMADNNTSCFNFRNVAGTKSLSKHAFGRAIDINPRYNPYVHMLQGKQVVDPANGAPYAKKRTKKNSPMIITTDDLCYRLFIQHGFTWGGAWKTMKDYQHFQK